jgi:hypothetical protein
VPEVIITFDNHITIICIRFKTPIKRRNVYGKVWEIRQRARVIQFCEIIRFGEDVACGLFLGTNLVCSSFCFLSLFEPYGVMVFYILNQTPVIESKNFTSVVLLLWWATRISQPIIKKSKLISDVTYFRWLSKSHFFFFIRIET